MGDRFIRDGQLEDDGCDGRDYAAVPLAMIEVVSASIIEDGKAVKAMGPGDAYGVFDTACFLRFGHSTPIGGMTLGALSASGNSAIRRSPAIPLPHSTELPYDEDYTDVADLA